MIPCLIRIPRTASTSICRALGKHFDHKPASQVKKEMGEEWDKSFKFTIVRNPYDRFLSMFKDFTRDESLDEYVKENKFITDIRFKPQDYYLDIPIDYIGRFEELDKSWEYICEKLDIQPFKLPHLRQSNNGLKLNNDLKEIIYKYYFRDFEFLKYNS